MQARLHSKIIDLFGVIKTKLILEIQDKINFEPIVISIDFETNLIEFKLSKSIIDSMQEYENLVLLELTVFSENKEHGISRLLKSGTKNELLDFVSKQSIHQDVETIIIASINTLNSIC